MKRNLLLIVLLISLYPSVINLTYLIKYDFNSSYSNLSNQPLTPESIINDFIDYPPYIERYVGTKLLNVIEYDPVENRVFYSLTNSKIGIYYFENTTFQEINLPEIHNYITALIFDPNLNNLFVGSTDGLFIIDMVLGNRTHFDESTGLDNSNIYSMAYDTEERVLFLNTYNGLNILFANNHTFLSRSFFPSQLQVGSTGKIAFNSNSNLLYLTAGNKLFSFNLANYLLEELFYSNQYNYDFIRGLYYDNFTNTLFMGCHGVISFNCSSKNVLYNYNTTLGLLSNVVSDLIYTPDFGGMIFATQNGEGMVIINTTTKDIIFLRRENGLLTNIVASFDIGFNSESFLLFGTRGAFSTYAIEDDNLTATIVINFDLPTTVTRYLSLDANEELIFISANNYLSIYNITSKQFSNYDYISGLNASNIQETVFCSNTNCLYIGSNNGLFAFNLTSEEVFATYNTLNGLTDINIESLCLLEKENVLLIGTNRGLNLLNLTTNEIVTLIDDKYVVYSILYCDSTDDLFLGTSNHLVIINYYTKNLEYLELDDSEYSRFVKSLDISNERGILYAGTGYGIYQICIYNRKIIKHYTTENSKLTDNNIDDLFFDQETGKLYIANLGIVLFDTLNDFWININDAQLEGYDLFLIYISNIVFSNNKVYFTAPYNGFYIIDMNDIDDDGIESCLEIWIYSTNPNNVDTDQDGFTDGYEIWNNTDPLDPKSFPRKISWWGIILIITLLMSFLMIILILGVRKRGNKHL